MPDAANPFRQSIRPIAICVFWNDGRIFVFRGYDRVKGEVFYRPLGGGINFGERSADTIIREIHEEIGAEVTGLKMLGVIENIFVFEGQPKHEIVLVYDGQFSDPAFYSDRPMTIIEDNGETFDAMWKPLSDFETGDILYPSGLLDLLQRSL